jgi:hypothetical protein
MKMNNNNKCIYGGVGADTTPTHSTNNYNIEQLINKKIFCLKTLKNYVYRNIYYLLFKRGYIYKKELEKLLLNKISNQLEQLLNYGIIEKCETERDFAGFLYELEGYNYYNVQKIKLYRFTEFGFMVFKFYEGYIEQNVTAKVKSYSDNIEATKIKIKEQKKQRYLIKKSKKLQFRTAEDEVFIREYERENDKKNK